MDENATVQTNTQSNPSEVVSVTEDVVAAVASGSGGSVGNKPTMAEVTAGRYSVPDLMIFDTVKLSSDINTDKTTTTGKQVSEGVVGELEVETESIFKVPNKRKKVQQTKIFKQTKKDTNETESLVPENDSDSSDSNCSYLSSQNENDNQTTVYKVEDISKFLKETKGLPGVQVEDYFPDRSTFINDAKILMKEGAFADKEVFRLRKIKLMQLKDIVEKAGPGLKDAGTVAIHLGIRSVRVVSSFLNKLDGVLNFKEKALLESYSMGDIVPDANDLFPDIRGTDYRHTFFPSVGLQLHLPLSLQLVQRQKKQAETHNRKNIQQHLRILVLDFKRAKMSDTIYNNVIWTETEGINGERVEMMVDIYESADCVREDDIRTETNEHNLLQHTGSDCVKIRNYRAAAVCLVLLCVLLLTAVIVLCVHIHTNYTEDRDELLTKITNLTEERKQLLITIEDFKTEKGQLEIQNQKLTNEKKDLELLILKRMLTGGRTYNTPSIYIISSEKKSWSDSRQYCKNRGADLIIINNREEQDLVKKMSIGNYVWIGLTDIDEEGKWKWVDSSTPTSRFWRYGEPNGHRGENCVVSYASEWSDYPCRDSFHSICEKSILK
ncbi:uncharacterized protein [Garra rufa]|uniref:uncharacterized protein n=1 Tax=Garra rufa TaxID=137080 RepID=UPI003CCE5BD8